MALDPLFRKEVLQHEVISHFGKVLINTPVSYLVLTIGMSILVCAICLLFLLGEHAEQFMIRGYLNSSKGIVRIYPSKNGIVKKCMIQLGQKVKKGQPLFLIDTGTETEFHQKMSIIMELKKRKQVLNQEIIYKRKELEQLKPLLKKNYISQAAFHQKQQELSTLVTNKNLIEIEEIHYKQSQSYLIRAPVAGSIASIVSHVGQYTTPEKPLAKLLPKNTELMAELFVPIRNSGFLEINHPITIQYDAYPPSRFGNAKATILEISHSALTDNEEEKPFSIGEAYYKVIAKLEKQTINAYGTKHDLQQDMTINAVVTGEKKKFWQWFLEPFYL